MNALAKELNEIIAKENPAVLEMLSDLGQNLFMPKGIITQSAEAKEKAHKYNVTIGIATDKTGPMFLDSVYQCFTDIQPKDIFPYAPSSGKPELRARWKEKIIHDTPSLKVGTSLPIVTNALTHGLKIVSDMFINRGDTLVLPAMFWGNYRLTFATMGGAEIATYNTFNEKGGFDVEALLEKCRESAQLNGKIVVVLNFPNNPSGYAPTTAEAHAIADGLVAIAENGTKVVAVTDDAYYGLFYEEDVYPESVFALLAGRSDNLLAVKLDGSTKEHFVWGLRVGFITFGYTNTTADQKAMMGALEKKVTGLIRGTISNCPHSSQSIMLRALNNTEFDAERAAKVEIMKGRAKSFKRVLAENDFSDQFEPYPFNSGYFMCLKLKKVDAEELRVYLLDKYGVGAISVNKTDLRLAFSCLEESDTDDLFRIIYQACGELSSK